MLCHPFLTSDLIPFLPVCTSPIYWSQHVGLSMPTWNYLKQEELEFPVLPCRQVGHLDKRLMEAAKLGFTQVM